MYKPGQVGAKCPPEALALVMSCPNQYHDCLCMGEGPETEPTELADILKNALKVVAVVCPSQLKSAVSGKVLKYLSCTGG